MFIIWGLDYIFRRNKVERKWTYKKCDKCKKIKKHYGKGLCASCYRKYFYNKKKRVENWEKWSRKHSCCIDCGRRDRPHQAHGRCGTCYTNNMNRKKGKKKRNFGAWSWYYNKCRKCGTIERPHVKNGLCYDCYVTSKRDFSHGYKKCPVCGAKTVKLNQHLSMRAKKCEDHRKYQYDLFKIYFDSDLGLDEISKELNTERHIVTRNFIKYFGKKETDDRNQKVKSCLISDRAKIGFNNKNRFGTIVYYESLNNGRVRFRSKLELRFAKMLDSLGERWVYEGTSFPYIDKSGNRRTYTPDFYLQDKDKYIELKGYEKEDDQYKIDYLKGIGINIEMLKKGDLENATL